MSVLWDDLRMFLAVSRAGGLTGAGKMLRVDPATVGRRITRLEEALEAPLFARSPQGYALTERGQRLMTEAVRVEQAMDVALETVGTPSGGLSGQIRIGAPDGCANYVLPQVCARIVDENPDLEVQIVALPRVFNLSKREADMAVGVSRPTTGRLTVQKIADYHLHLAATEEYLETHPPIKSLPDLQGHRVVGYIPDMIFDKELDYLAEMAVKRVSLGSNSVSVQFNWVRQGNGVGVVHDFAIPSTTGVKRILTDQLSLKRSFYLIRHADDRRLERMNRFAKLVADGVKSEIARLEGIA